MQSDGGAIQGWQRSIGGGAIEEVAEAAVHLPAPFRDDRRPSARHPPPRPAANNGQTLVKQWREEACAAGSWRRQ